MLRRRQAAFHGEFGSPEEYVEQMTSAHGVNAGAFLQEICGLYDAFADEGVVGCGSGTVWVEAPRDAAKPQSLETTGDKMVETKRLKFQDTDADA